MAVTLERPLRSAPEPEPEFGAAGLFYAVANSTLPTAQDDPLRKRWADLFETVSAMVEEYAAAAPDAIKREAMTRLAGWIADAQFITMDETGPIKREHVERTGSPMRRSGAMAILSPYRPRRVL